MNIVRIYTKDMLKRLSNSGAGFELPPGRKGGKMAVLFRNQRP